MPETKKKDSAFLGTYFDRDAVIRMARIIEILSWIVAGIYAVDLVLGLGILGLQIARGVIYMPGLTDYAQQLLYLIERPLHGLLYFAAMQGAAKGLLILLDLEENTRRAARK